jgi:AraC family transcriptional regulator
LYAAGSKCLHVVIPPNVEHRLTCDFGTHGAAEEIPSSLSIRSSIVLHREFTCPDRDSPLIVEAVLLDLVSRHLDVIRDRFSARPRWLGLLLDYLDDTVVQAWSLRDIAAEMGVHPVHLCRTFSKHFGCTLGAYIG